jgi:hypothetical protein
MLFTKPENLNGTELQTELVEAGINVNRITVEGDGSLNLDIDPKNESKAAAVIAAHNGTTVATEPTIEDKLASVGLNLTDLKSALGL